MTTVDWVALGVVGLAALNGLRKGLIASALSLAGIVAGAVIGAHLAPHLLSRGAASPWTPVVGLAGAVVGATLLHGVGSLLGSLLRSGLRIPPFRALDTVGGLLLGAATGFGIVWVLGAVALQLPGQTRLREEAQRSRVLQRLNELVPPSDLMHTLARYDPFPRIAGPSAPTAAPTSAILRVPAVRRVAPSVVRVLGTACGLDLAGTGWIVRTGLVLTAAHVVAGEKDTHVEQPGSTRSLSAQVVGFDARNDLAVLRVRGLAARPLPVADPKQGEPVAILGYPGNGPLSSTAGRVGRTSAVLTDDAYGHGPVLRTVTSLRARVRHGDSGAPAVDARGAVEATIFASSVDGRNGYGVPVQVVERLLAGAGKPVSSGPCAP